MGFLDSSDILWQEVAAIVADEGLALYDLERLGDGGLRIVIATSVAVREAAQETTAQQAPTDEAPEDEKVAAEDAAPSGRQGGVTTGDCARVCRRLMTYFTVEGPRLGLSTEPTMEVSSPGINRQLRRSEHFESAVGQRVKIVWQQQLEGKTHSETTVGELTNFAEGCLSLVDERSGDAVDVLLNDVRKARVDFPF